MNITESVLDDAARNDTAALALISQWPFPLLRCEDEPKPEPERQHHAVVVVGEAPRAEECIAGEQCGRDSLMEQANYLQADIAAFERQVQHDEKMANESVHRWTLFDSSTRDTVRALLVQVIEKKERPKQSKSSASELLAKLTLTHILRMRSQHAQAPSEDPLSAYFEAAYILSLQQLVAPIEHLRASYEALKYAAMRALKASTVCRETISTWQDKYDMERTLQRYMVNNLRACLSNIRQAHEADAHRFRVLLPAKSTLKTSWEPANLVAFAYRASRRKLGAERICAAIQGVGMKFDLTDLLDASLLHPQFLTTESGRRGGVPTAASFDEFFKLMETGVRSKMEVFSSAAEQFPLLSKAWERTFEVAVDQVRTRTRALTQLFEESKSLDASDAEKLASASREFAQQWRESWGLAQLDRQVEAAVTTFYQQLEDTCVPEEADTATLLRTLQDLAARVIETLFSIEKRAETMLNEKLSTSLEAFTHSSLERTSSLLAAAFNTYVDNQRLLEAPPSASMSRDQTRFQEEVRTILARRAATNELSQRAESAALLSSIEPKDLLNSSVAQLTLDMPFTGGAKHHWRRLKRKRAAACAAAALRGGVNEEWSAGEDVLILLNGLQRCWWKGAEKDFSARVNTKALKDACSTQVYGDLATKLTPMVFRMAPEPKAAAAMSASVKGHFQRLRASDGVFKPTSWDNSLAPFAFALTHLPQNKDTAPLPFSESTTVHAERTLSTFQGFPDIQDKDYTIDMFLLDAPFSATRLLLRAQHSARTEAAASAPDSAKEGVSKEQELTQVQVQEQEKQLLRRTQLRVFETHAQAAIESDVALGVVVKTTPSVEELVLSLKSVQQVIEEHMPKVKRAPKSASQAPPAPAPPAPPAPAPAPVADDGLDKYRKMVSMGIPLGAVKQRMKTDNIAQTTIDEFTGVAKPNAAAASSAPAAASGAPVAASGAPVADDGLDKYRKMVSMGIPLGAVKQRMKAESIAPKIIEGFMGESDGTSISMAPSADVEPKKDTAPLVGAATRPPIAASALLSGAKGLRKAKTAGVTGGGCKHYRDDPVLQVAITRIKRDTMTAVGRIAALNRRAALALQHTLHGLQLQSTMEVKSIEAAVRDCVLSTAQGVSVSQGCATVLRHLTGVLQRVMDQASTSITGTHIRDVRLAAEHTQSTTSEVLRARIVKLEQERAALDAQSKYIAETARTTEARIRDEHAAITTRLQSQIDALTTLNKDVHDSRPVDLLQTTEIAQLTAKVEEYRKLAEERLAQIKAEEERELAAKEAERKRLEEEAARTKAELEAAALEEALYRRREGALKERALFEALCKYPDQTVFNPITALLPVCQRALQTMHPTPPQEDVVVVADSLIELEAWEVRLSTLLRLFPPPPPSSLPTPPEPSSLLRYLPLPQTSTTTVAPLFLGTALPQTRRLGDGLAALVQRTYEEWRELLVSANPSALRVSFDSTTGSSSSPEAKIRELATEFEVKTSEESMIATAHCVLALIRSAAIVTIAMYEEEETEREEEDRQRLRTYLSIAAEQAALSGQEGLRVAATTKARTQALGALAVLRWRRHAQKQLVAGDGRSFVDSLMKSRVSGTPPEEEKEVPDLEWEPETAIQEARAVWEREGKQGLDPGLATSPPARPKYGDLMRTRAPRWTLLASLPVPWLSLEPEEQIALHAACTHTERWWTKGSEATLPPPLLFPTDTKSSTHFSIAACEKLTGTLTEPALLHTLLFSVRSLTTALRVLHAPTVERITSVACSNTLGIQNVPPLASHRQEAAEEANKQPLSFTRAVWCRACRPADAAMGFAGYVALLSGRSLRLRLRPPVPPESLVTAAPASVVSPPLFYAHLVNPKPIDVKPDTALPKSVHGLFWSLQDVWKMVFAPSPSPPPLAVTTTSLWHALTLPLINGSLPKLTAFNDAFWKEVGNTVRALVGALTVDNGLPKKVVDMKDNITKWLNGVAGYPFELLGVLNYVAALLATTDILRDIVTERLVTATGFTLKDVAAVFSGIPSVGSSSSRTFVLFALIPACAAAFIAVGGTADWLITSVKSSVGMTILDTEWISKNPLPKFADCSAANVERVAQSRAMLRALYLAATIGLTGLEPYLEQLGQVVLDGAPTAAAFDAIYTYLSLGEQTEARQSLVVSLRMTLEQQDTAHALEATFRMWEKANAGAPTPHHASAALRSITAFKDLHKNATATTLSHAVPLKSYFPWVIPTHLTGTKMEERLPMLKTQNASTPLLPSEVLFNPTVIRARALNMLRSLWDFQTAVSDAIPFRAVFLLLKNVLK